MVVCLKISFFLLLSFKLSLQAFRNTTADIDLDENQTGKDIDLPVTTETHRNTLDINFSNLGAIDKSILGTSSLNANEDDWNLLGNSQQQVPFGASFNKRASSLYVDNDFGDIAPTDRAGDELVNNPLFDKQSVRSGSSYSDIERVRRTDIAERTAGPKVDSDLEDDSKSIVSDMDDSVRGRQKNAKSSSFDVNGQQSLPLLSRKQSSTQAVDMEEDYGLGEVMGLTNLDPSELPMADYDYEQGGAAVDTPSSSSGSRLGLMEIPSNIASSTTTTAALGQKAKRIMKQKQKPVSKSVDEEIIIKGDTIRAWLDNTSSITRKRSSLVSRMKSSLLETTQAFANEYTDANLKKGKKAAGNANTENPAVIGVGMLHLADAMSNVSLGPDQDFLHPVPTTADVDVWWNSVSPVLNPYNAHGVSNLAYLGPKKTQMILQHASGKSTYANVHGVDENAFNQVFSSFEGLFAHKKESKAAQKHVADGAQDTATMPFGADDADFALGDSFALGDVNAQSFAGADASEPALVGYASEDALANVLGGSDSESFSQRRAASALGSSLSSDVAMSDAESTVSAANGEEPTIKSHVVDGEKWHASTIKMLQVLAQEMTGPSLPVQTKKRKATAPNTPQYDFSDLNIGKGSASDPISFSELSSGSTRRTAAVSFYQLLVLATFDTIHVKQTEHYGDVEVTRGPNFAPNLNQFLQDNVITLTSTNAVEAHA
jgi:Conserved region of Rad21 / Rec8 like protein